MSRAVGAPKRGAHLAPWCAKVISSQFTALCMFDIVWQSLRSHAPVRGIFLGGGVRKMRAKSQVNKRINGCHQQIGRERSKLAFVVRWAKTAPSSPQPSITSRGRHSRPAICNFVGNCWPSRSCVYYYNFRSVDRFARLSYLSNQ